MKIAIFVSLIATLGQSVSLQRGVPSEQGAVARSAECTANLPPQILKLLQANYSQWRIQTLSDLSPAARRSWDYKKYWKPNECPGVAIGQFEARETSYALLIVPKEHPDSGYKLLAFARAKNTGDYKERVLEVSDKPGASDALIRKTKTGGFFDARSRKQFASSALDAILFLESGTKQFGA